MKITDVLDGALDRSVALGYSNIGSRLRRLCWPADPPPKAMAGKRHETTTWSRPAASTRASESTRTKRMHPGWAETPGVAESLPTFQRVARARSCVTPLTAEDAGTFARFLDEVSAMTDTSRNWAGLGD